MKQIHLPLHEEHGRARNIQQSLEYIIYCSFEYMLFLMVLVTYSHQLSEFAGGKRYLSVRSPSDLEALFSLLENSYPLLVRMILDDCGRIRKYVNVFVDGEDARNLNAEKTSLAGVREVIILPSVAGG